VLLRTFARLHGADLPYWLDIIYDDDDDDDDDDDGRADEKPLPFFLKAWRYKSLFQTTVRTQVYSQCAKQPKRYV
jgi:hypothetical protein